jgi:hypothetical protein
LRHLLRWIVLIGVGIGIFFLGFDAAVDVEDAYAAACQWRGCPPLATEIYVLKLCAIIAAIAMPAALAWAFDRLDRRR